MAHKNTKQFLPAEMPNVTGHTRVGDALDARLEMEVGYQQVMAAARLDTGVLPADLTHAEAAVKMERWTIDRRHQFIENAWKSMQQSQRS